jgi:hypothetical protein
MKNEEKPKLISGVQLTVEQMDALQKILVTCDVKVKEFLLNAIVLFTNIIEEKEVGASLGFINKDGTIKRRISILMLELLHNKEKK